MHTSVRSLLRGLTAFLAAVVLVVGLSAVTSASAVASTPVAGGSLAAPHVWVEGSGPDGAELAPARTQQGGLEQRRTDQHWVGTEESPFSATGGARLWVLLAGRALVLAGGLYVTRRRA